MLTRLPRLAVLAMALVLALPAMTLAATASTNDSFTVNTTLTLTGVPATLDYGAGFAGDTLMAPSFNLTWGSNNASGTTLSVAGTDFVDGTHTLPATIRSLSTTTPPSSWIAFGAGGESVVVRNQATPLTVTWPITMKVDLPSNAVPADYAGTVTFTAVANP